MNSQSPEAILPNPNPVTDIKLNQNKSSLLWKMLQILIGLVAFVFVLTRIDQKELLKVIAQVNYFILLGAVLNTLFMTYLMGWRWQLLIKVKYKVSSLTLFGQYLTAQFFNLFTPGAVGGDLARLLRVGKITGDSSFVFTSIVVERLVSLVGLLLSSLVGLYLGRDYLNNPNNYYFVVGLLIISIFLCLLLFSKIAMKLFLNLVIRFELLLKRKLISKTIEKIGNHLAIFSQKPLLLLSIILTTFLVRTTWTISCWLVAQALGLNIPLFVLMALFAVVDLARMLPISPPNGIGVREYLLVLLLAPLGISNTQAALFSFLAYSLLMVNGLIGGLVYTSQAMLEKE